MPHRKSKVRAESKGREGMEEVDSPVLMKVIRKEFMLM
jgi:hypothetical protein